MGLSLLLGGRWLCPQGRPSWVFLCSVCVIYEESVAVVAVVVVVSVEVDVVVGVFRVEVVVREDGVEERRRFCL